MSASIRRKPNLEGVAAAGRALTILAAFRKGDDSVTLSQLAERTGIVKSTIMRLALTLEEHGFLIGQANGSYRLGAELLRLGALYQDSFRLDVLVMPRLEMLARRTGESASFFIEEGGMRRCLFRVDSPQALRVHVRQGDSLPLDNSAIARVLKQFGPQGVPGQESTIPIYSAGATDPHLAGLAVPVFGPGEQFRGSLSITGPLTRLTKQAADAAAGLLVATAVELSLALGGRVPEVMARMAENETALR
jgi:DNA-binding IclR family transcriptional regulator